MGTPTARNVAPAGSEYADTVQSNHCSAIYCGADKMVKAFSLMSSNHLDVLTVIETPETYMHKFCEPFVLAIGLVI
ncbi:hypothetical protein TNCV_4687511 [Trichonephila clavipes]|nr:hypothetical protein TNCV_4687511 [Trichonephila clavipes]